MTKDEARRTGWDPTKLKKRLIWSKPALRKEELR